MAELYSSEHPEELPVTQRVQRRQARRQAALERHRAMGRQGRPFEPPFNVDDEADLEERRQAHAEGAAELDEQRRTIDLDEQRSERTARRRDRLGGLGGLVPRSAKGYVDDGAGFILGLFVYALVLNYVKGGTPRLKGWLAAKFLNRPYTGPAGASVAPAKPSAPTNTIHALPSGPTVFPITPSAPALPGSLQSPIATPPILRVITPIGAHPGRLPTAPVPSSPTVPTPKPPRNTRLGPGTAPAPAGATA